MARHCQVFPWLRFRSFGDSCDPFALGIPDRGGRDWTYQPDACLFRRNDPLIKGKHQNNHTALVNHLPNAKVKWSRQNWPFSFGSAPPFEKRNRCHFPARKRKGDHFGEVALIKASLVGQWLYMGILWLVSCPWYKSRDSPHSNRHNLWVYIYIHSCSASYPQCHWIDLPIYLLVFHTVLVVVSCIFVLIRVSWQGFDFWCLGNGHGLDCFSVGSIINFSETPRLDMALQID